MIASTRQKLRLHGSSLMLLRIRQGGAHGSLAFTLTELLVVIGIIAILGSLTIFSVGSIFKDAKMSSGVNTVMASLDNARALAMKNNKITLVAFRSRSTGENDMFVEAVIAEWSGESFPDAGPPLLPCPPFPPWAGGYTADRFRPVPGAPVRRLPAGIKVATPEYAADNDDLWLAQAHLPAINPADISTGEVGGVIVVVAYNGRGEVVTTNSESDVVRAFVDFNDDFLISGGGQHSEAHATSPQFQFAPGEAPSNFIQQSASDDEPFVSYAPFIAVYDDDAARETYDTSAWLGGCAGGLEQKNTDLTEYITAHAKRIHFNRYTGVAMK